MARARNIKPSFFTNDVIAEINALGRLLFIGMWTIADREGRMEDRPKKIKAEVLPYDDCDVDSLLNDLAKHGFILRYSVGNNKYIQILTFTKHQNPHVKESESTIPAPDLHQTSPVQETTFSGASPADSLLLIPDSPLPIPKTQSRTSALVAGFDEFWMRYPKKVGKDKALTAWKKKSPRIDDVMYALSWQINSEQWRRDGGQFIPHPSTYINEGRWQDEPPQEVSF